MKKLMFSAAAAAMAGAVYADAQVWEMALNVKTTEAKIGTVKAACEACDGATSYRKQASVKIAGLFWGCTCDEMVGLTGPVSANEGVFFWNATKKAAFYDQDAGDYAAIDFAWDILNRIGPKASDCEGVWDLAIGDFVLRGAGFGTVKGCDDATYVNSMKGNFAGTYIAGNGCKRCEEATGSAWALCDCSDPDDRTAAYGTWTLKFNSSATKKFENSSDWSWYKFPGDTLDAINALIDGPAPVPVTPADAAKAQYAAAKAAYDKAVADVDAAKAEKAKADAGDADWVKSVSDAAVADFQALKKASDAAKAELIKAYEGKFADVFDDWSVDEAAWGYYDAAEAYMVAQNDYGKIEKPTAADAEVLDTAKNAYLAKKDAFNNQLAKYPSLKADIVAVFDKAYAAGSALVVKYGQANETAVKDAAVDARKAEIEKVIADGDKTIAEAKAALDVATQTCIITGADCK